MPTNLHIDEHLLEEAKNLGKHKTKRATVEAALEEYIRRHKQLQVIQEFGEFDFDTSYDYKVERKRAN